MSTLFKDIYSEAFYETFSDTLENVLPSFDRGKFKGLIFISEFDDFELKQRMLHTAETLHHFLPEDFSLASDLIVQIIQNLRGNGISEHNIEYMFFPEYISMYGIDHYDDSVKAMEYITQFTSCEFAVRPFILKYEEQMIQQMLAWSKHEHHMVRRLASEGSRPRLPWGMGIPSLKKDPTPILPILYQLKEDPTEIVRRSVANNLNDIAKDHPDVVVSIAKTWKGGSKETDALVKHACRTLLKQAHPEIMKLYGLDSSKLETSSFTVITPRVKIGDHLEFSFNLRNTDNKSRLLRLEYGIHYLKKNGELSRKVFKISEREIEQGESLGISRKQSFKPITTRVFYPGRHRVSIIVNGTEMDIADFELYD